jgi:hypothetical protein
MRRGALATILIAVSSWTGVSCTGSSPSGTEQPDAAPPKPTYSMGQSPRKAPPSNVVGGFSIDVPPVTLKPGDEINRCTIFPLNITGPSRMVGGGTLTTTRGLHHGNITTRKKTGEGIRRCGGEGNDVIGGEAGDVLEGGAVLFGSSTQYVGTEWQSFPDGMAYRIKDGYEVVARMHYLNPGTENVTVAPRYEWFTVAEDKVTQEIAPFFWAYGDFEIPPRSTKTVTGECNFGGPMNIVMAMPHMHAMGTQFTVGFLGGPLEGENFLVSKGYDPDKGVMVMYEPSIQLGQGDGARFSCTWRNPLDKTIVEGIGENEMCMLFGYSWPPKHSYSATVRAGTNKCLYIVPPG